MTANKPTPDGLLKLRKTSFLKFWDFCHARELKKMAEAWQADKDRANAAEARPGEAKTITDEEWAAGYHAWRASRGS